MQPTPAVNTKRNSKRVGTWSKAADATGIENPQPRKKGGPEINQYKYHANQATTGVIVTEPINISGPTNRPTGGPSNSNNNETVTNSTSNQVGTDENVIRSLNPRTAMTNFNSKFAVHAAILKKLNIEEANAKMKTEQIKLDQEVKATKRTQIMADQARYEADKERDIAKLESQKFIAEQERLKYDAILEIKKIDIAHANSHNPMPYAYSAI